MAKIIWTDQALDDLNSICEFIARDALRYAQVFADRVFKSVERLEDFPKSGRVVPELGIVTIREIILGNYRIAYRLKNDEIEVITVFHSARLLDTSKFQP
ncbi:type II toxin-antitoxin system RelE/ParE family toxin [candidate division KSB1 bacterium]|nr:type II toxin-antitoxin system RelE/ParE family toxin [candidate division KSB1 bacterium]NIR70121.1 type II toxin-antitoxin system RelE/ParE family toxin [candidate division KSB1 bacterium]NIS25896.1 type II toxin-antitoxin system RelE/ParE family toxin [candidate division KSB1 bacterium]NIT72775.1 type II toxin-antitoxin system RelE/ParE family toxin [candidate division KSB1 bacterium]NIU26584.1 type II toxin-antitoxin system RelE/ParE family toxin [candidate division KSB1 bacterium]